MKSEQPVRTRWTSLVAVCGECHGGKRFGKALRGALKKSPIQGVRVVRSSCLDVCPKRGVTVATMREGRVVTVVVDDRLKGAGEHFCESLQS